MTRFVKDGVDLEANDTIVLRKQARRLNNLTSAYTVSYSFELPKTSHNLSTLGIVSVDQSGKRIYSDTEIILIQGNTTLIGNLRVERITSSIECSFFSDSFDFLKMLTGSLRSTRFRDYTYNFPNKGTSGYVDIPINNGTNRNTWNSSAFLNYLPCFWVKDVIKDVLQEQGIKLTGDIVNDWRYNHLVVSNTSPYIDYDDEFVYDRTVFAGKTADQSITGATVITFTSESGVYFDNPGWWDGSDDYQPSLQINVAFELNLLFDTSGAHTVAISGSTSGVVYTTTISAGTSCFLSDHFLANSTEDYSVVVTPAVGTISVLDGSSFKVFPFTKFDDNGTIVRATFATDNPRFLMPAKTKAEFVSEIFSMFNPVIDFDPLTKVLKVDLFEKVPTKPEEDWSDYLVGYDVDFEELLQDYTKKSLMVFGDGDEETISLYNKANQIPFGGGSLNIENDFIPEQSELLEIPYPPSHMQLNVAQQAYFPVFSFFPDEDELDNRLFLAIELNVSDFSNRSTINGQSTLCYGWFVKENIGKGIDNIQKVLAFENPVGYSGIGLKQDYFRKTEAMLNDPVKLPATMRLPETVYNNLDFSTPKRIKTEKFNAQFFCLAVEGWINGHDTCEVELIKL